MKIFILILFSFLILSSCQEDKVRNIDLEAVFEKNMQDSTLATGWYYIEDDTATMGFPRQLKYDSKTYYINPKPIVVAGNFEQISLRNKENMYLLIKFDKMGTEQWSIATKASIGKTLAVIINNELVSNPLVNMQIDSGHSAYTFPDYGLEDYERMREKLQQEMELYN